MQFLSGIRRMNTGSRHQAFEVAILDPQALMLPALRLASLVEINSETVAGAVREEHRLSDDDLTKLLSGKPWSRAINNASWAIVWLGQAGLIQQVRDKAYTITECGRDFLAKNSTEFNLADLRQLPTWKRKNHAAPDKPAISVGDDKTEETAGPLPENVQVSEPEARQSIKIQAEMQISARRWGFEFGSHRPTERKSSNLFSPRGEARSSMPFP
jgi:restriction endonuclease Mrr